MPFDRDKGTEEIRAEAYMAALSMLAAGLSGDTEAAEVVFDTTSHQALIVALTGIAAVALEMAGTDPAQWVAGQQALYRACLADGGRT